MVLKVFNSLNNQLEVFEPLEAGKIKMYVCGPTVYNYIHIGNARSVVAFDTIRRYLEYLGYQVDFVSNFTDVDDKMIQAATADQTSVKQIAKKYIEAFYADTKALNVKPATNNPRATENIPEIITFIQSLLDKGYAYVVDQNVYYRARRFPSYGQLSHQALADLETGASQHVSKTELNQKEDPIDFTLWKAAKPEKFPGKRRGGRAGQAGTLSVR